MQSLLAGVAVGASLLGLAYAWLARRGLKQPSGWTVLLGAGWGAAPALGAAVALTAFLFTLPNKPPWSAGLLLGFGILIGALCALMAVGEAAADASSEAWAGRSAALLSLAALGPSLILILFRGDPRDALIGCAIGGAAVAMCCIGMLTPLGGAAVPAGALCRGLESYVLSSSAVVAGTWLAIERYPRPTPFALAGGYWAVPGLLTAVCALFLVLFSAGRGARLSPARFLATGVCLALGTAVTAVVLHWRLLPDLAWTPCLFAAVGFGLIGLVFLREDLAALDRASRPILPALAAIGVVMLVGALAWQASEAYGQALALVSAAAVAMLMSGARPSERGALSGAMASGGAAMLLLMTWYRLYAEDIPHWRTLDFQQHYQFLAVALGVGAVFVVLGRLRDTAGKASLVWRTIGLGAAAIAAPLFVASLWGERAVAAYLGGLVVSEVVWMLLAAWSVGDERTAVLSRAPHVYLLASAFMAACLTRVVVNFELTRLQKVNVIAVLAALALIVYVAGRLREMTHETPA